jgi:hypothetical protein
MPIRMVRLLENLDRLPDAKSREVLGQGLEWARDHPESIQIHTDRKSARQGHFPNLVAFANLLHGAIFAHACKLGCEGIASKRADSAYPARARPG